MEFTWAKISIDEWAKKLIEYHRNPSVKTPLTGSKLFIPQNTEEEHALVRKNTDALMQSLKFERVERRCARTKGNYQEGNLVKIEKVVGDLLRNFGMQNRSGTFLSRVEALYLLEMNRLEIIYNMCNISIQQAYSELLSSEHDFEIYHAYKNLTLFGFKLYKPIFNVQRKKRKRVESETPKCPKVIITEGHECVETTNESQLVNKTMEEPISVRNVPDYKLCLPGKQPKTELNLYCCENINQEDYLKYASSESDNIVSFPFPDSVAFYYMKIVDIPVL